MLMLMLSMLMLMLMRMRILMPMQLPAVAALCLPALLHGIVLRLLWLCRQTRRVPRPHRLMLYISCILEIAAPDSISLYARPAQYQRQLLEIEANVSHAEAYFSFLFRP